MGGMGSGNWYRWDRKTTTEESKNIDIRVLHRSSKLTPGIAGQYSWSCNGEPTGSIQFRVENHRIVLVYRYRENEGEWVPVEMPILIDHTSCNYGGSRPWFTCPNRGCRRRVAILYSAGMYFACRHCSDLAYSSQQENVYMRMARKSRKIIKRLGGDPCSEIFPNKPKHMHWKTYNRLIGEAEYYEDLSWAMVERYLGIFR